MVFTIQTLCESGGGVGRNGVGTQAFLTGDDLNGSREMKRRRKNRDHQTAAPEYRAVGLLIMDRKNKYGWYIPFYARSS